jgi:transketolase
MRRDLAKLLLDEMSVNEDIYLITGDLGYGLWDSVRDTFPDRFFNVGSSEMVMMGTAIGLAMEGKIPFVYSITPFAIYRPYEMIRNYLNHESIPVNILGGGRDRDYGYLGFSHWADDDKELMKPFTNIKMYHPETEDELKNNFRSIINDRTPSYLNLKK